MSKALIFFFSIQLLFLPHLQISHENPGKARNMQLNKVRLVKPEAQDWPLFRYQPFNGAKQSGSAAASGGGC